MKSSFEPVYPGTSTAVPRNGTPSGGTARRAASGPPVVGSCTALVWGGRSTKGGVLMVMRVVGLAGRWVWWSGVAAGPIAQRGAKAREPQAGEIRSQQAGCAGAFRKV